MADFQTVVGGMPTPSEVLVNCDQQTVVGDGSVSDPLTAPQRLIANAAASLPPGTPVKQTNNGLAAAQADSASDAQVIGLLSVQSESGEPSLAQWGALLTLTPAQWQSVVTGLPSSGLVPGAPYYLSLATAGLLTGTVPTATGSFNARVGIAASATTMLVLLNSPIGPHA